MRQLYIICIALSSFFTYSISFAWEQLNQHSFFVPGNVFQENTTLQEIKRTNRQAPAQGNTSATKEKDLDDPLAAAINPNKKIKKTLPYVKKIPKVVSPKDFNQLEKENIQAVEIPSSSKYTLDNDLDIMPEPEPFQTQDTEKQLSALDLYSHKSVEEMLSEQPYPNKSLPKFKQRVALYDVELRNLYRRESLPTNREQDNALAKASSGQYFSVP